MADHETQENVEGRLSRIEGQLRGIRNMTAEGRGCVDGLTQISAVRAALKKVADVMVAGHVHQWVDRVSKKDGKGGPVVEESLKVSNQYYR
jgi:DNA-binding FrmR family transcriptional regulator